MTRTPGERTRPDDRTAQHPGQLRRPHPAVDQSARQITEGLAGTAGLSDPVLPQAVLSLQGLPHPGALSAAQLNLIASSVAAQRGRRASPNPGPLAILPSPVQGTGPATRRAVLGGVLDEFWLPGQRRSW